MLFIETIKKEELLELINSMQNNQELVCTQQIMGTIHQIIQTFDLHKEDILNYVQENYNDDLTRFEEENEIKMVFCDIQDKQE